MSRSKSNKRRIRKLSNFMKDIKENLNSSSLWIRRHYKIKIAILPQTDHISNAISIKIPNSIFMQPEKDAPEIYMEMQNLGNSLLKKRG